LKHSQDAWVGTVDFPYDVIDGLTAQDDEQLYPIEKFTDALKKIALWIFNDGKFRDRGVTDRAMVFAFMVDPNATGCATQAELAERMKLSRTQVNEYVKQFTKRFNFVSANTYTTNQRRRPFNKT
jgi:hypothetical protein